MNYVKFIQNYIKVRWRITATLPRKTTLNPKVYEINNPSVVTMVSDSPSPRHSVVFFPRLTDRLNQETSL